MSEREARKISERGKGQDLELELILETPDSSLPSLLAEIDQTVEKLSWWEVKDKIQKKIGLLQILQDPRHLVAKVKSLLRLIDLLREIYPEDFSANNEKFFIDLIGKYVLLNLQSVADKGGEAIRALLTVSEEIDQARPHSETGQESAAISMPTHTFDTPRLMEVEGLPESIEFKKLPKNIQLLILFATISDASHLAIPVRIGEQAEGKDHQALISYDQDLGWNIGSTCSIKDAPRIIND